MMKLKKWYLILLIIGLLLITGCGKTDNNETEEKEINASETFDTIYFEEYSSLIGFNDKEVSAAIIDFNNDDIPEILLQANDKSESYICYILGQKNDLHSECLTLDDINWLDLYYDKENDKLEWMYVKDWPNYYCYTNFDRIIEGNDDGCMESMKYKTKISAQAKYEPLNVSFIFHKIDKSKALKELKKINDGKLHYETEYSEKDIKDGKNHKDKHLVTCDYYDKEEGDKYHYDFYYENNKLLYFDTEEIFELERELTSEEEKKAYTEFENEERYFKSLSHDRNIYTVKSQYDADDFFEFFHNDGKKLDFTYDGVDSFIYEFKVDDTTCEIKY